MLLIRRRHNVLRKLRLLQTVRALASGEHGGALLNLRLLYLIRRRIRQLRVVLRGRFQVIFSWIRAALVQLGHDNRHRSGEREIQLLLGRGRLRRRNNGILYRLNWRLGRNI